ncbi:MAG: class I SAM-dependent DNA methyltransferase [Rhodothermales bacterium]
MADTNPSMRAIPGEKEVRPYSVLAAGYDVVMVHVDYDGWAEYVHGHVQEHHPEPKSILELGCGTGSLALALQPKGPYQYTATDGSPDMIRIARCKAERAGIPIAFGVADFSAFRVVEPVDVVVLLYDGLNYLLEFDRVEALLRRAYDALRPGGLFLFDQSTPRNSLNNADYFEDAGQAPNFTYERRSRYDHEARLHTTMFDLTVGGVRFHERHVQRAYELGELRGLIQTTSFEERAAYEDFSTLPATADSERIHWVLRRPTR